MHIHMYIHIEISLTFLEKYKWLDSELMSAGIVENLWKKSERRFGVQRNACLEKYLNELLEKPLKELPKEFVEKMLEKFPNECPRKSEINGVKPKGTSGEIQTIISENVSGKIS